MFVEKSWGEAIDPDCRIGVLIDSARDLGDNFRRGDLAFDVARGKRRDVEGIVGGERHLGSGFLEFFQEPHFALVVGFVV